MLLDGDKIRYTKYRPLADPKNSLEEENLETDKSSESNSSEFK